MIPYVLLFAQIVDSVAVPEDRDVFWALTQCHHDGGTGHHLTCTPAQREGRGEGNERSKKLRTFLEALTLLADNFCKFPFDSWFQPALKWLHSWPQEGLSAALEDQGFF